MRYQFTVRAPNAHVANLKVTEELNKILADSPEGAAEKNHAETTANAFINLLAHDESNLEQPRDIFVMVEGNTLTHEGGRTQVDLFVRVQIVEKEQIAKGQTVEKAPAQPLNG